MEGLKIAMKVKVKYLAGIRNVTGKTGEEFELENGTLEELINIVDSKYSLKERFGRLMIIVNEKSVWSDFENYRLSEKDEVVIGQIIVGG